MSRPPLFQRSPRLIPRVPAPEIQVPAPPTRPMEPAFSFSSVLLMVLPALVGALVIFFISRGRGGSTWMSIGMSVPMLAVSAGVQVARMVGQRRAYDRQMEERENRYHQVLDATTRQLQENADEQRRILCDLDPDPTTCAQRVAERSPRLWERSPEDHDFLAIRLGVGPVAASAKVKAPQPPGAEEPDPLLVEALQIPERFAVVDGVPVQVPLREVGVVGVVGPRASVLEATRGLLCHLAVHHSPDEAKVAVIFDDSEVGEWAWARWLPHVWASPKSRMLAADPNGIDRLATELYEMIQRRRLQQMRQNSGEGLSFSPSLTIVLSNLWLVEKEPLLPLLLREGASLGATLVVLASRKEELPKECKAIIQVDGSKGDLILTSPSLAEQPFVPDSVSLQGAEDLARSLAPVRLNEFTTSAEIPGKVTLLDLLGIRRVEEVDLVGGWREVEPFRSLAVPLGLGAGREPLLLDLHERGHGPHGLVAGATGSGKSELLQTLVAALAYRFHPHDLALVLVDYKGGGMANAFLGLPHLVGTITNLGGNLTRRALAALKAELRRRQRLLGEAGVNHVDAYMKLRRRGQELEPLPHLLIIVDEFAELKSDQPDFMRELISAVRVGRSLGVHLILATQKPAGVVDEQIWSNARFRICLRVERPEDSQEVLKSPEAAFLTEAGRAYLQVGNNERFELFQAGWGGALYQPEASTGSHRFEITEVGLDGVRYPLGPQPEVAAAVDGQPQLTVLLNQIKESAQKAGIPALAGPWLPPLPETVQLRQIMPSGEGFGVDGGWAPPSEWMEAVVGLLDAPEHQAQVPLRLDLGKEGHLAVYGAPGSGKTTFLQTLVTGLAFRYSPSDCHIYLVDGGGRSLVGLQGLPHVGGVVLGDEQERVQRLTRMLMQILEERKVLLGEAGVNTLEAYRQVGTAPLPGIVVVVDSYATFVQSNPDVEDAFAQIAREGGGLGLHLVLAANTPGQIRSKVAGNISMAVALQMADRGDYSSAVGRTGGLEPMPVPGRGLVKAAPPLEFQTALPAPGESEWERAEAIKAIGQRMQEAWSGSLPRPVRTLPEEVALEDVDPPAPAEEGLPVAPVALDVESLDPFVIPLTEGPNFLITGPAESGKTTLLQTWGLSMAQRRSPEQLQLFLVDMGGGGLTTLRRLPHVKAHVTDATSAEAMAEQLTCTIQERRAFVEAARQEGREPPGATELLERFPAVVILLDDVDSFRDMAPAVLRDRLEQLVRRDRGLGIHLVVAGLSSVINQLSYEGLVKALKEGQTGIVLGSSDHSDLQFFNIRIPGESGRLLSPGMGFYARRGRWRRIKVATPRAGGLRVVDRIGRIAARWIPGTVEVE
ncbi:MAG: type VII secretion protein EssC [Bacillota bacterium]